MKTTKIISLMVISISLLSSCKKGEDDPFLSLTSRDKRITGTWECTEYISEEIYSETYDGTTNTYSEKDEFNGTILTNYEDGILDQSWSYAQTLSINDDGTFEFSESYDQSNYKTSGRWWWRSNDKKKSMIDLGGVVEIKRLTNKELVIHFSSEYGYSYSEQGSIMYSESDDYYATYTYEKQK